MQLTLLVVMCRIAILPSTAIPTPSAAALSASLPAPLPTAFAATIPPATAFTTKPSTPAPLCKRSRW